jgi:mycofactocin glycosyltransferase
VFLAAASRRSRPALAAAVVVPAALEWWERRPALDPVRFLGLRLADDLAYASGVWIGCGRERSAKALLPALRSAQVAAGAPD